MSFRVVWLLIWCPALVAAQDEAPRAIQVAEPPVALDLAVSPDQVLSKSGQFRVSGGDKLFRGTVTMLAEKTKDELYHLTGEQPEWKVPVTIRLHGRPGDPLPPRSVRLKLLEVGGARELQLDVHLSRGIDNENFKRAVTAALLYERALIGLDDPERKLSAPPWLVDGLREATDWRLLQSEPRLYATLFKQGGLFKLDDMFSMSQPRFEQLDGASRAAFRVSAGALVMALLEQPNGRDGFRAFLDEVAGFEGEVPVLMRKHFPELNLSETSLAKWWALQLANKGALNILTDVMSIEQTEAALEEALFLNFRTLEGIFQRKELSAWPELVGLEPQERFAAVRPAQDALVRLSYRCFPSYRPLLMEYQAVLDGIVKNETAATHETLMRLEETRVTMLARSKRARDYLDWFEITRARTISGAFDDYLRLKERLKSRTTARDDAVSVYLDRMDEIFYREEADTGYDSFGFPGY
ncbi:MAG: hypothetical protein ACQCXQ_11255 [Verrucomicrobiales bacterium]|nr:hypothetical protein [Verrucomicrobiota bacterium JB025]